MFCLWVFLGKYLVFMGRYLYCICVMESFRELFEDRVREYKLGGGYVGF